MDALQHGENYTLAQEQRNPHQMSGFPEVLTDKSSET